MGSHWAANCLLFDHGQGEPRAVRPGVVEGDDQPGALEAAIAGPPVQPLRVVGGQVGGGRERGEAAALVHAVAQAASERATASQLGGRTLTGFRRTWA